MNNGYLYPPPEHSTDRVLMIVVEKKGDETRSSMRQDEIFAYSPQVIIRDGCMVLSKHWWDRLSLGQWISGCPVYSEDKYGSKKDERSIEGIEKVPNHDLERFKLPPSQERNGYTQIYCRFVIMPEFIRNRSFRCYRKLYLQNIGQGFYQGRPNKSIKENVVYFGIFEFRSETNGAVNFRPTGELTDRTHHTLERGAMWELIEVCEIDSTIGGQNEMRMALEELHQKAKKYNDEIIMNGGYKDKSALFYDKSSSFGYHKSKSRSRSRSRPRDNMSSIFNKLSIGDEEKEEEDQVNQPEMTMEEKLEHRSQVIIKINCRDRNGNVTEKWKDRETDEVAPNNEILIFKFNHRYKIPNDPPRPSRPSSRPPPPLSQKVSAPLDITSTDSTFDHQHPIACSTPLGSPVLQRRSYFGRREPSLPRDSGDSSNMTANFVNDFQNNYNPRDRSRRRRFIGPGVNMYN